MAMKFAMWACSFLVKMKLVNQRTLVWLELAELRQIARDLDASIGRLERIDIGDHDKLLLGTRIRIMNAMTHVCTACGQLMLVLVKETDDGSR